MPECTIEIRDEVNCKIHNLDLATRRECEKKLKYFMPHAYHTPAYKLGRWDGCVSYFTPGGGTYINMLDNILDVLEKNNYTIDIKDKRTDHSFKFPKIDVNYHNGKTWPEGHVNAGANIVLRDYQVDIINQFLEQPQCLQEVATGAGKTIITATLSNLVEPYGRTIVVVPNKDLVSQTFKDYENLGLDVGVYFGDKKDLGKTHTICTWQSLNVINKKFKDAESDLSLADFAEDVVCIIIDECLDGNTLITTPLGKVPIKDLKAGDKVINFCEKTKQYKEDIVIKVHKNLINSNSEKMLELEFDNGIKTQVTANHKFLTNKGWIRADQLTEDITIIDINTYN